MALLDCPFRFEVISIKLIMGNGKELSLDELNAECTRYGARAGCNFYSCCIMNHASCIKG